jgi:PhnB protein
MRMKDIPQQEGMPSLSQADMNKVMHVELPILGGTKLMGTDMLETMGHQLIEGNNVTISLNPDTKEEADRMYKELSQGGADGVAPHDEFWGYWGTCKDKFGIRWMFNVFNQPQS